MTWTAHLRHVYLPVTDIQLTIAPKDDDATIETIIKDLVEFRKTHLSTPKNWHFVSLKRGDL